jgi:hypothetical protein
MVAIQTGQSGEAGWVAVRNERRAVSSVEVYETALRMVERYGFGLILATAVLWFVRTDLVLPMVESHQEFLIEMSKTQREITAAIREQTQLLYALQPKVTATGTDSGRGTN